MSPVCVRGAGRQHLGPDREHQDQSRAEQDFVCRHPTFPPPKTAHRGLPTQWSSWDGDGAPRIGKAPPLRPPAPPCPAVPAPVLLGAPGVPMSEERRRSYAELLLLSRPRARYQSRAGVPRSLARPFAAASPIASTIMPARVRLSAAARAAAASMTSVIRCCRRLASRASCRVLPDMGAGAANPMLIVMSSRSPGDHPMRCAQNFGMPRTP